MEMQWFVLGFLAVSLCHFHTVSADTYKVTCILEPPFLMEKSPGSRTYKGFIVDLMDKISKEKGFDYTLNLVRDGKYGMKTNGNWDGMIGEVNSGAADLIAAPLTITKERQEVLTFTNSIKEYGITALMHKPKSTSIKVVADLSKQTKVKYAMVQSGSTANFFKNSNISAYKKMWQSVKQNWAKLATKVSDGVSKVRKSDGNYAFLMESSMADYWKNIEPCDLYTLDDLINDVRYGFAVSKNHNKDEGEIIVAKINDAIQKFKTNGEMRQLEGKWWKLNGKCARADNTCSGGSTASTASQIGLSLAALSVTLLFL